MGYRAESDARTYSWFTVLLAAAPAAVMDLAHYWLVRVPRVRPALPSYAQGCPRATRPIANDFLPIGGTAFHPPPDLSLSRLPLFFFLAENEIRNLFLRSSFSVRSKTKLYVDVCNFC